MAEVSKFIAIEGGDGSGKATQAKLLADRARRDGITVAEFTFPRYDQPSARYVTRYLNGQYGEANETHPDLASLPYALDRLAAASAIREFLDTETVSLVPQPRLAITDRYVRSNCAHQGTKIETADERAVFYEEIAELEYGILNIPRPDLNITLIVPTDLAQTNIDSKDVRSYTSHKRDIHEKDGDHLENAKRNYAELVELNPDDTIGVLCTEAGKMRTREAIHEELWTITCKLLNQPTVAQ